MASFLRHELSLDPLSIPVLAFPWYGPLLESGLYLESPESRYPPELFGPVGFHGAISSVGSDGFQPCRAQDCAER